MHTVGKCGSWDLDGSVRWMFINEVFAHNSTELAFLSQPKKHEGQKIPEIASVCVVKIVFEYQLHHAIHHQINQI